MKERWEGGIPFEGGGFGAGGVVRQVGEVGGVDAGGG